VGTFKTRWSGASLLRWRRGGADGRRGSWEEVPPLPAAVKMSTAPSMQSKQASSRTLPLQAKQLCLVVRRRGLPLLEVLWVCKCCTWWLHAGC
jgi:hypothetical protein